LPNSHVSNLENPQNLVGKTIKTVVLEVNRELRKVIFSQKQVLGIKDFKKYVKDLKLGQKIEAKITNISTFGIYLSIPTSNSIDIEGFVHISEISWENIVEVPENFEISQKIEAVIAGFDEDSRRVLLSIKRLLADPFEQKMKEFSEDKKLKANVIKIISSGVLLDLGEGITGIIKKDKIPANVSYKEGQSVEATVSSIDKKRHRVVVAPILKEKPIGYR
jgi:ribosomal protein S1